ncbi:MAG TPA: DUF5335 family protein [Thermoleophilaceae bacterium]|nr:DUF5335 family protein [Thermoleophilaceae bacterium]
MAVASQEITRESWREYFDEFSRTVGTAEVTLELAGRDIGDQIAAERLVLTGITYDDEDDVLVVGLDAPGGSPEEYEHMIASPERIYVATTDNGETTFDVTDAEGRQHLIHMTPAPALPPSA